MDIAGLQLYRRVSRRLYRYCAGRRDYSFSAAMRRGGARAR
ncbi:hypothetical protein C7S17_0387 [Burkholderia thailandensis]|nr:hypothetical protein [Burkholderia thailandensis]